MSTLKPFIRIILVLHLAGSAILLGSCDHYVQSNGNEIEKGYGGEGGGQGGHGGGVGH